MSNIEVPHFIHFGPPPSPAEAAARRRWWGLGVICVAMFISAMDMTIVNVALPDMSSDLDAGIGELQWVLDAFLVSLAGLLLVGSGLADRFGRRRVFLFGFVGFAAASVLAAASQTVGEVIAARVLMGVAAACVLPPALSLLAVLFPPELRPKALGVWSAVAGLGLALGPVAGGVLVHLAGWRWVFLVNVPFVLLAAPLGLRWLPESHRPGTPPLDLPGVALSIVALTGIVFALIEGVDAGWTTPAVVFAAAGGIAGGVAFFAVELRRAQPLFDVRVLVRPRVAVGGLAILASYLATLGMLFLLPQYVQYVRDGSALAAGFELAPFGLGLGALAAVSGRLVGRYGARAVLLAGLLTAAAGFVPLLFLSGDSSPALVVLGSGIVGCGGGLTYPPATAVIMNDLGTEKAGDGAAVNQLARQVGGALGVAIVGSVFAAVYEALMTDGDVPAAAKESIEDATDAASRLHGAARADLLHDAVASFDVAARWGLAVCMAAVLLSAAAAAIGLSRRLGGAKIMTAMTPARVLIVAHRTAATPMLIDEVRARARRSACTFTLLVPRPYWDPDTEETAATLELALPLLDEAVGGHVDGVIGDTDPFLAVEQALEGGGFDEIIISTLPARVSHWLRRDLPHRVERLGLPVTVVTAKQSERAPSAAN